MARTSNLANIATVTRASKAWDDGWSGVSGGTVGTLTEYASGVARYGANGLLVEAASTNAIRNPRGESAGAGSTPTNHASSASGTVAATWGTQADDSGWPGNTIQFAGTPIGDPNIALEGSNHIAAAQGEVWTFSVTLDVTAGDFTNMNGMALRLDEYNAGAGFISNQLATIASNLIDGTKRRFFATFTIAEATCAYIRPRLQFDWDSGAIDITLRFAAAQLEEKAYPTSPILPVAASPAASTRAADVVSITAGAWYADEPFSIAVEFSQRKTGSLEYVLCIADPAGQDYSAIYISGSNSARWFNAENGSITENKVIGTFAGLGASSSVAIRQAVNDLAASVNGSAQVTDATWVLPVNAATRLVLGANPFGSSQLCGYIKEFRYWPRALTDAELEALVGN